MKCRRLLNIVNWKKPDIKFWKYISYNFFFFYLGQYFQKQQENGKEKEEN